MTEQVRIEGLREFRAAVRAADASLGREIRKALNKAAEIVAPEAQKTIPRRTGRLAASVRPASTQTEGRVAMGSNAVPYAGWMNFGGAVGRKHATVRPRVPEGRYLYPAFQRRESDVQEAAEDALNVIADIAGTKRF